MHIEDIIDSCYKVAKDIEGGKISVSKAKAMSNLYNTAIRGIGVELKGQTEKYKNHNVRYLSKRPPEKD